MRQNRGEHQGPRNIRGGREGCFRARPPTPTPAALSRRPGRGAGRRKARRRRLPGGRNTGMKLEKLGDLRLTYATLEAVDYATGGQLYGTMAGRIDGARLSGELQLTNLAARRPDNVNLPTLRGILRTDDGAVVWVEMDGIATL